MEDTFDLYKSSYYIHQQPTWGDFPASCGCLGCCKWTICQHTALLTSLVWSDIVVPDKLVAETPALRKKCSKVRGTAGPRRARLLRENAKQKKASTSKLAYVSDPVPPVQEPDPPVSYPVTSEDRQASPPPVPRINQPSPNLPASDEANRLERPARQAIAAPSAKKVNSQSAACFT